MTRYSPIIGPVIAWQLLMPVICFFAGISLWVVGVTAVLFVVLLLLKNWEKNSYSIWSVAAVVALSLALIAARALNPASSRSAALFVLWVYAMIAYTATSPYPLAIRMPLIVYTLAFLFMIPAQTPRFVVLPTPLIFSFVTWLLARRWRAQSIHLDVARGPQEPPFSMSLAIAIVAAVLINLCVSIARYHTLSKLPGFINDGLLSLICLWLLWERDWKKNVLAVAALVLMITSHLFSAVGNVCDRPWIHTVVRIVAIAPVMFHTTAPVFRGMRIVITLYAVYNALNRHALIAALSASSLPLWQQHLIIVGIDAILALVLFAMAIHWKTNRNA